MAFHHGVLRLVVTPGASEDRQFRGQVITEQNAGGGPVAVGQVLLKLDKGL